MSHAADGEEVLPSPIASCRVQRCRVGDDPHAGASIECVDDRIAEEVPVALEYNGVSHAVMMATPQDLHDFAIGFSLTEGIVDRIDEIYDIEIIGDPLGIRLAIDLSSDRFAALKTRRRSLAGRTGCGLCGAENLAQALRDPPRLTDESFRLPATALHAAFSRLRERQPMQQVTGATHAAGWVDAAGDLSLVREDVGRHNALDKLLGALAGSSASLKTGAAITTSRASVEMVQKAGMLGVPILATVSGPTDLAVRTAERIGLTLAAFFRERGHVRYCHGRRLDP